MDDPKSPRGKLVTIILGAVGLATAGAGWYLDICLKDQRETLRAVRETWPAVRETSQKYVDDRIALYDESGFFYRKMIDDSPTPEWIAGRQQELISALEKTENSCNAAKNARYDFDRKLGAVSQAFYVEHPNLAHIDYVEQMCGKASQAAARLRIVDPIKLAGTAPQIKTPLYERALVVLQEDRRIVDTTREAERDHNRSVEEFFGQIDNRSVWTNIWSCVRATFGSK